MKEDHFTNTPEDAAQYEACRGEADDVDDRPTLAELQRDEYVDDDDEPFDEEPTEEPPPDDTL